mgnify:CR=1 FL=1
MRTSLRSNPPALAVAAPSVVVQESMVEIQVTIPEEWQKRLEDLASRLAAPMEKLSKIAFCRAIATFENMTLAEYDALVAELGSQSHNVNAISIPEMEVKE